MSKSKTFLVLVGFTLAVGLLAQATTANSVGSVDPAMVSIADILRGPTNAEPASSTVAGYLSVADTLRESKAAAGKLAPSLSDSLREQTVRLTTDPIGVSMSDQLRAPAAKSTISLADSLRERAGSSQSSVRGGTANVSMADQLR